MIKYVHQFYYPAFFLSKTKKTQKVKKKNDCKNVVTLIFKDIYIQVVFLFSDLQIKDETFLEDISMILTTGSLVFIYIKYNINKKYRRLNFNL